MARISLFPDFVGGDLSSGPRGKIFVSYSHEDKPLIERFVRHLRVIAKYKETSFWWDQDLESGSKWRSEIGLAIDESSLALVMVSPGLLNSSFISDYELPRMFDREAHGLLRIAPILLRPCPWQVCPWLRERQIHMEKGRAIGVGTEEEIETQLASLALKVLDWLYKESNPDPDGDTPAGLPRPRILDLNPDEPQVAKILLAKDRFSRKGLAFEDLTFLSACQTALSKDVGKLRHFSVHDKVEDHGQHIIDHAKIHIYYEINALNGPDAPLLPPITTSEVLAALCPDPPEASVTASDDKWLTHRHLIKHLAVLSFRYPGSGFVMSGNSLEVFPELALDDHEEYLTDVIYTSYVPGLLALVGLGEALFSACFPEEPLLPLHVGRLRPPGRVAFGAPGQSDPCGVWAPFQVNGHDTRLLRDITGRFRVLTTNYDAFLRQEGGERVARCDERGMLFVNYGSGIAPDFDELLRHLIYTSGSIGVFSSLSQNAVSVADMFFDRGGDSLRANEDIRTENPYSPYYWTGFEIQGEWQQESVILSIDSNEQVLGEAKGRLLFVDHAAEIADLFFDASLLCMSTDFRLCLDLDFYPDRYVPASPVCKLLRRGSGRVDEAGQSDRIFLDPRLPGRVWQQLDREFDQKLGDSVFLPEPHEVCGLYPDIIGLTTGRADTRVVSAVSLENCILPDSILHHAALRWENRF